MSNPDRFVCPVCRLEADVVHMTDQGLVCQSCAMRSQERDDKARWKASRGLRESPAEKCGREAREFDEARERGKEGPKRG